ncbi:aldo-keto reductase family 1 member B1-like isoform X1 [Lampetra fluviatilis]
MTSVTTAVTRLSSGVDIPLLGLGTWKSKPGEVRAAVEAAISAGYRHVDGAFVYENEAEVGAGIASCLAKKVASREQLFIVSKLWGKFHASADVKIGFMKTLTDLKLDYLDLFLMHSPMAFKNEGDDLWPTKDGKILAADVDYVDTWKAMEVLVKEGLVKSIGVSNFNIAQLQRLLSVATIKPAVNQVELHPYLPQPELIEFCQSNNVVLTAYSPFGSPDREFKNEKNDPCSLLQDTVVEAIGSKHGKTSAQVLLRYHTQRNIVVIPKSVTPSRIVQNAQSFDFTLDGEDTKKLLGLRRDWRACDWDADTASGHPNYPFDS